MTELTSAVPLFPGSALPAPPKRAARPRRLLSPHIATNVAAYELAWGRICRLEPATPRRHALLGLLCSLRHVHVQWATGILPDEVATQRQISERLSLSRNSLFGHKRRDRDDSGIPETTPGLLTLLEFSGLWSAQRRAIPCWDELRGYDASSKKLQSGYETIYQVDFQARHHLLVREAGRMWPTALGVWERIRLGFRAHDGRVELSDRALADALGISPSNLARYTRPLQQAGLLRPLAWQPGTARAGWEIPDFRRLVGWGEAYEPASLVSQGSPQPPSLVSQDDAAPSSVVSQQSSGPTSPVSQHLSVVPSLVSQDVGEPAAVVSQPTSPDLQERGSVDLETLGEDVHPVEPLRGGGFWERFVQDPPEPWLTVPEGLRLQVAGLLEALERELGSAGRCLREGVVSFRLAQPFAERLGRLEDRCGRTFVVRELSADGFDPFLDERVAREQNLAAWLFKDRLPRLEGAVGLRSADPLPHPDGDDVASETGGVPEVAPSVLRAVRERAAAEQPGLSDDELDAVVRAWVVETFGA